MVDVYPDISIRAANLEVPLPSVIALTDYVKKVNQRPAFTRRNVFLRDEYKCQYCNDRFHTADLSLDHVKPRCMGGQLNWWVILGFVELTFLDKIDRFNSKNVEVGAYEIPLSRNKKTQLVDALNNM